MTVEVLEAVVNVFIASTLLPFFIGSVKFRFRAHLQKLLIILTGVSFIPDAVTRILYFHVGKSTRIISVLHTG
jgi:hypothetical protein